MSTDTTPSDTPETDAAEVFMEGKPWAAFVAASTARTLERQRNALQTFAQEIIDDHPDGFVNCDEVQDIATKHGLLAEVTATGPCCDGCRCQEAGHWPATCIRPTPLLTGEKP